MAEHDQTEPLSLEDELTRAVQDTTDPVASTPETTPEAPTETAPEATPSEPPALIRDQIERQAQDQGDTTEQQREVIEKFRSILGDEYATKYKSDEELIKGLVNTARMVGQRNDEAAMWRAFQQNPEGFLQQWGYARADQPQPQPGPAGQQPANGDIPEYDPTWQDMVVRDPVSGAITGVKPGADPTILSKLAKAEQWASRRQQDLLFHPEKVLEPLVEQKAQEIAQMVEQRVQQQLSQRQVEQEAWNWINQPDNRKWIFNDGDPSKGLSQDGAKFQQYVEEGVTQGGIDPGATQKLIGYAKKMMELDYLRSQVRTPRQQQPATTQRAAMAAPNMAAPTGDDDVQIHEGESLEQAMLRLCGVKR